MWKTFKRDVSLALCSVALVGCGLFQAATPQTPSQAVAYAYGTVASVRQTAANALQSGEISVSVAQTVLADTDKVRSYLDAAETVLISNPADTAGTAMGDLQLATTLLSAAQALLPSAPAATPTSGASGVSL